MSALRGMRNDRAPMGDAGSAAFAEREVAKRPLPVAGGGSVATREHEVSATGGKRKPIANCEYLMCPLRRGEPTVKRERGGLSRGAKGGNSESPCPLDAQRQRRNYPWWEKFPFQ